MPDAEKRQQGKRIKAGQLYVSLNTVKAGQGFILRSLQPAGLFLALISQKAL